MSIDKELLKQLSAKVPVEPDGIEGLVRGIHRKPGLREWVTLESVALVPVPVKRGDSWVIISLLAVPKPLEAGATGWFAPWGAVEWTYPEMKVAQMIDLRLREDTAALRTRETISDVKLSPKERSHLEKALFGALEQLLSNPPEDNKVFATLTEYYAKLLPEAIYPYYWTLIPESKEWLDDDLTQSAVTQDLPVLETPNNLSDRLGSWLYQCQILAKSSEIPEIIVELQAIDARLRLPGFRLAFVGEFSRGKSTLLNRLLERDILPIGVLPTTATMIAINAGAEDRMLVTSGEHSQEMRSLTEASWQDLLATNDTGHDQEVLAQVRVTLAHHWLQTLDAELIDTPGAADLNTHRAALVFDLLSQCDAAVLVISATLPFSMTEAAFLEQEVIGRHIPRILVVVSKLDSIAQAERAEVMTVIKERVAKVSPAIPVVSTHPVDEQTAESEALEAIRSHIAAMVAQGDRQAWRSQKVAGELIDVLGNLIDVGKTAIASAKISAAEREQRVQKAKAAIRTAGLEWERIHLELDQRRIQHAQTLRQNIFNAKAELLEALLLELTKTPNPHSWWELDLPFYLRRELITLGRKAEDFLLKATAQDFQWLQSEVSRTFSTQIKQSTNHVPAISGVNADLRELEISPIQHYRLLTRIGSGVALIGSYLIGGPVAVAISVSLGAGLLSDHILTNKIEEQRQMIEKELERAVDKAFDEYCNRVSERLKQLYQQLADDIKREQVIWLSAQIAAIKASSSELEQKPWQQMIDQASALKQQIFTAVDSLSRSA
jgi:GTP-binding protein EngB required for normal cell division